MESRRKNKEEKQKNRKTRKTQGKYKRLKNSENKKLSPRTTLQCMTLGGEHGKSLAMISEHRKHINKWPYSLLTMEGGT